MAFVRELLLMIEAGRLPADGPAPGEDRVIEVDRAYIQKLVSYLDLLKRNAIIQVAFDPETGVHSIGGLTDKGRDFLDEIR